jgi:hypothetical protein
MEALFRILSMKKEQLACSQTEKPKHEGLTEETLNKTEYSPCKSVKHLPYERGLSNQAIRTATHY